VIDATSIRAESLALGPSCVSATPQLKREWSLDISEFESYHASHAVGLSASPLVSASRP
jgi:hypothetical protein